MDFNSLLKYQETDIELRKLKKEMLGGNGAKTLDEAKRRFNDMKQVVAKNENLAAKVYSGYNESVKHYEQTCKKAEDLIAKLDNDDLTEEQADAVMASLESIKAKLAEIEGFIMNIKKKGEDAVKEYTNAQKDGKEIKDRYTVAKDELKKREEVFAPKIEQLQKELSDARKKVPAEILEKYEKITAEGVFPPFAPAYVDASKSINCSACGFGLPLDQQSELREKGYCRCDKCRRVIFLRK